MIPNTNNYPDADEPSWSPDGNRIAYTHYLDNIRASVIFVINVDGSNLTQLTSGKDSYPSWSPDGAKLVFSREMGNFSDLYTINSSGGTPSLLLSGSYHFPDYSPDGTKIVCSGYADNLPARIFVVNINGTGLMPLTDSGGSYDPAWSPDGTQITYSFDDVGGSSNEDIYVMNANGSNKVNITNTPDVSDESPDWQPALQFNLLQTPTFTVSDSTGNNNGFPEPGETLTLTIPLFNGTGSDATGTTLQIVGGGSANYGTITDGSNVSRHVSYKVPANTPCGSLLTLTFNVNSSLGAITFTRQIIIGAPTVTFSENFDSVTAPALPAGWTATIVQNGINFVTSTTNPDTAPNSAFALDPTTVGGGTDLTSPSIPITASAATISFRNRYDTQANWDGGVLEISIGGGVFQDILTAGGSFVEGGYNDTLGTTSANNPLAGRRAWSGNSGGYITTTAQLPASAAGQNVRFRWRFGADNNTGGPGWSIDTIKVVGSYNCSIVNPARTQFDFDGDGKSDISVFRPSNGVWYLLNSTSGFSGVPFGIANDKLAPADFDGDGRTDIAVFRNGIWYLLRSKDGFLQTQFGQAGDVPIPADFDGDGKADLAVYRDGANGGQSFFFYLGSLNNPNKNITFIPFGSGGDKPVVGDYDGDGKADPAVYRNGIWYLLRSQAGAIAVQFGITTDKVVPADFDGDGKTDLAVYRNGVWYVLNSSDSQVRIVQFGLATDVPTVGDYDGDGKADFSVWRASNGVFYVLGSQSGFMAVQFGTSGDVPIASAYIP